MEQTQDPPFVVVPAQQALYPSMLQPMPPVPMQPMPQAEQVQQFQAFQQGQVPLMATLTPGGSVLPEVCQHIDLVCAILATSAVSAC
jgi:hypothetical protein